MSGVLRPARAGDAQAIGAVFDAAVRAGWTYLGDLAARPMFTPGDWDQLVADHQPPNLLLVAVAQEANGTAEAGSVTGASEVTGFADAPSDEVIGFVAVHPDDGEMFLLFVHPGQAGRGTGRMLLAAAHDALRDAGRAQAHLFVHERNERALSVYHAAGYRPDGTDRVSDFRGTRIRELRLVKQL